jgi:hypothetical protein
MPRKRGSLSSSDMAFIEKNVDKMSPSQIASQINRTITPVKRYIERNRLGKQYAQAREMGDKTETIILKELKRKPFYDLLRKQLSIAELDYFNNMWISILDQFNGDLFPSEELELKELILLDISKDRMMIDQKNLLDDREAYKKLLFTEMQLDPEDRDKDQVRFLRAEISAINDRTQSLVKSVRELTDKSDRLRKALKASREQRYKDIDNAKVSFSGWLKTLTKPELRAIVAKEMEIMRIAMEKERIRLAQYITYENNEIDKPILSSETVNED